MSAHFHTHNSPVSTTIPVCNTKQNKNKIKPITSATSVKTVSALEGEGGKLWYLTNQLTTTASNKPERVIIIIIKK